MAFVTEFVCAKCNRRVREVYLENGKCYKCNREEEEIRKKKWLIDRRYHKTLKQRITWVEEWIYKHGKNHPVKEIVYK